MTSNAIDMLPKLFVPTSSPAPLVQSAQRHPIDSFQLRIDGRSLDCVIVLGEGGELSLHAGDRKSLAPQIQAELNVHELLARPRVLESGALFLVACSGIEGLADLPGMNDPIRCYGEIFGPFPSSEPMRAEGVLTLARLDLLRSLVASAAFAFHRAGDDLAASGSTRWFHAVLPGGAGPPDSEPMLLVVPMSSTLVELGEVGNEHEISVLIAQLLEAIESDEQASDVAAELASLGLPVVDRSAVVRDLESRGYTIDGDRARRSILEEPISIPRQGDADEFLMVAGRALELLLGAGALAHPAESRMTVPEVFWSVRRASGLHPVPTPDGPFTIQDGEIVSTRWRTTVRAIHPSREQRLRDTWRCLYFDVSSSLALEAGGARVEVEFFGGGIGYVWLEYDSRTKPYQGVRESPVPREGERRWRSQAFELPDPLFSGRQNGGADFRITIAGAPLRIRNVKVRPWECAWPVSNAVVVEAASWAEQQNVAVNADYDGLVTDDTAYRAPDRRARYEFDAVPGRYEFFAEYASNESRPVRLVLNGAVVNLRGCGEVSGGWEREHVGKFSEGAVDLQSQNCLEIACDSCIPHFSRFRFEPS